MKTLLLVLLLLGHALAGPTMEDNRLPTDQEVLGQPEEVASLGLPSDEESFNRLSVFFTPGKTPGQVGSGTYHFVSSTFPEVDARGFHESVFDGIGDYFPSWPAPYKRDSDPPYTPSLAQRLGLRPHNRFRKRSDSWSEQAELKKKLAKYLSSYPIQESNFGSKLNSESIRTHEKLAENKTKKSSDAPKRLSKRDVHSSRDDLRGKNHNWQNQNKAITDTGCEEKYCNTNKRMGARYVRGMEMGSSGFHGDVFGRDFGDFTTMKKRFRGSASGFHGDTFSDGFGDFATMKRSQKEEDLINRLKALMGVLSDDEDDDLSFLITLKNLQAKGTHDKTNSKEKGSEEFNPLKKRKLGMNSMGFHGDTFSQGFGDFDTYKKRAPSGAMGFHGDTFSQGFGDFDTYKRAPSGAMGFHGDTFSQGFGDFDTYKKRAPSGAMGFHGDTFSQGFGDFDTYKRAPAGAMGFHGDTFSQGFGDFDTYKKRAPSGAMGFHGDTFSQGFGDFDTYKRAPSGAMGFHGDTFSQGFGDFDTYRKRAPAGAMGFHGDTFSQGFGDFDTYKRAPSGAIGFHGDTFSQGFGDFDPYKKRAPSGAMGFHGDTFSQGFGDFDTYKKRRPMGSMGFHGDTFSQGFGDFDTLKKRKPEMDSMGFHGDTFSRGFGDFEPFKKRRPNSGSMGFHGDTFSQGFGDFDPLKKRRLEMGSSGFHGDTFSRGFGDFDVYRKRSVPTTNEEVPNQEEEGKTEDKKCCSDSSIQRHQDVH